jgi:esterase/lipase
VLLIHGLGDSPWSFQDIGEQLAAQGFLVRTVLLAGHGTRPEDMLHVRLEDWRQTVQAQTRALQREVDHVYLGGFSTGANLALTQAYEDTAVAGLLLFSPAFEASNPFDWLTPWIGWVRPWLLQPNPAHALQNEVRYALVPTNGFAQFYRSSRTVRQALAGATYDKPVLMVVAEHDSLIDTTYVARSFATRFTHPASRLIWYGTPPAAAHGDPRVLARPDRLPDWRISQFSHMGVLFALDNPLYGPRGRLRICMNGQNDSATAACEQGTPVWFSDWGYQEDGKVHARLTFNPYFDWQTTVMAQVLSHPSSPTSEMARTDNFR